MPVTLQKYFEALIFFGPLNDLHIHTKGFLIISPLLSWICLVGDFLRISPWDSSPFFTTKNGSQYFWVTFFQPGVGHANPRNIHVHKKTTVDYARIKFTQRTFVRIPRIFGSWNHFLFFLLVDWMDFQKDFLAAFFGFLE